MKKVVLFIYLTIISAVSAQKPLTVEEAINIALKNNFDIQVAHNDAVVDKVNNTAGNAGMLPTIDLTGTGNLSLSTINKKMADGSNDNTSAMRTTTFSAQTQLSWTLYDGGKMFVTKNKLNEIESLGEIQFKDKVLQTLYNVIAAYYNVKRQQQQLVSIKEALNYNQERLTIAKAGLKAGSLLRSDLLTAQIDFNVTSENALSQQIAIETSKKELNVLLGQNADYQYEVSDSISVNFLPDKNELRRKLQLTNTNLLVLKKQIDIAQLSMRENESALLPQFSLKAGYAVSNLAYSKGTIDNSFNYGPQIGGTLVVPLYRAGENKRKISTAKIQVQTAEQQLNSAKLQVNTEFENAFSEFENQRQLLKIETENNQLAKENIQISLDRLKQGQTTSLEVRLAQEDFVQSSTRLISFKYNLKLAETKLKQLVAEL